MTPETVEKLNQLNQKFYQKIAASFSETRQTAWTGWKMAWEDVPVTSSTLSVCDVGCGNGRFGQFCAEQLDGQVKLDYLGIDQNKQLLEEADKSLQQLSEGAQNIFQFVQSDVVSELLNKRPLKYPHLPFQLVVCFGVLHHIPSNELRQQFVIQLAQLVEKGGVFILACWQFDRNPALISRQLKPEDVGISRSDLEENDYFLTWERDTKAVRYCHLLTKEEQNCLIEISGLKLLRRFSADGKTNDQNDYLILQKI